MGYKCKFAKSPQASQIKALILMRDNGPDASLKSKRKYLKVSWTTARLVKRLKVNPSCSEKPQKYIIRVCSWQFDGNQDHSKSGIY